MSIPSLITSLYCTDISQSIPVSIFPRFTITFVASINRCMNLMNEFDDLFALNDWRMSFDDNKHRLKIWQRRSESGLKAMKAESILDYRPIDIFRALGD